MMTLMSMFRDKFVFFSFILPKIVLTILLFPSDGVAFRMKNFEVPLHVLRGEDAVLKCEFDLEGERLYSIKWYKGGREFFRFVPNERPMKQQYKVQGVQVDMEKSTGQTVVLKSVGLSTSGRYKCEVLGEAPSFNTLVEYAILTVVAIPEEKPIVKGARERYHPGDLVHVNCTSAPSKPAATLTWYLNGQRVPQEYVRQYPPYMLADGLEQSTAGLRFWATHTHFPNGLMAIRCTAAIGVLYEQHEDASMEARRLALSLESREHLFDSASAPLRPTDVFVLLATFLALR